MTKISNRFSFTVKFVFYYFAFSHISSNKVRCQNRFARPRLDTTNAPIRFEYEAPHQAQYQNEIQMQYKPKIQVNFQHQNEGKISNVDQIQIQQGTKAKRDSLILNKELLEPKLIYEAQILNNGQQLFNDQVQHKQQILNQGQQISYNQDQQIQYNQVQQIQNNQNQQIHYNLDKQFQYNQDRQIHNNQAQKPYVEDQQLYYRDERQFGAQTPFANEMPNYVQFPFINELPNYAQAPFGNQMPNPALPQYGDPNDTKQDDYEVLNDIDPPESSEGNELIGSLLPLLLANNMGYAIRSGLKYYQDLFFGAIEKDTHSSMQSGLIPEVSPACLGSLKEFLKGLKEGKKWAIRMIDSAGKIPSGLLDGTLKAFGDFEMCVDTKVPEFQGRYCLVEISPAGNASTRIPLKPMNLTFLYDRDFSKSMFETSNDSPQLIDARLTTSICLPTKCTKSDIQGVFSKVSSFGLSALNFIVSECVTRTKPTFNSTQNIIFYMIIIVILLEVLATYLDVRLRNLYGDQFAKVELSKTVQCILAFSYYSNSLRLFKKDENPDSVKVFHGMKFFTMAWVILGHTISFYTNALGRLYNAVMLWGNFYFQIAANGFICTETFFFMSGFLVVYSFIKSNSPRFSFFLFALYRFIRLMPPVLFILGVLMISENLSSGPLWKEYVIDYLVGTCRTTWWRNLLFINNLTSSDSCLPWTWYIAVDMQLYLLSYFMLLLIRRNPKKALLVLKIFIVGNVIGIMFYHYAHDLPPTPVLIYIHILDRIYFTHMIHLKTFNHVTPYCVGMIAGYLIATKSKKNMSGLKKLFGSCMAILFGMITVFVPYIWNHRARIATITESVLYGGTQRLFWSLALSWMVYICLNGEASIIKEILSWNVFVPLARVTYSAFLVHPFAMMLFLGQLKHVVYADLPVLTISYLGFLVVSYMCAFIFSLVCESPFSRLLSILISSRLGKSGKKRKENFSV